MDKFSSVPVGLIGGATLSLVVSAELKVRIDEAAKNENVSVDTWALRVMEDALNSHPNADQPQWLDRSLRPDNFAGRSFKPCLPCARRSVG